MIFTVLTHSLFPMHKTPLINGPGMVNFADERGVLAP